MIFDLSNIDVDVDVLFKLLRTLVVIFVIATISRVILGFFKHRLLKRAKSKEQITNVKVFTRVFNYAVAILLFIFGVFSYVGSWTGLGISIGLLSAGLGLALQRPIMGMAAWIMMVTRRPFHIGDRIIIGTVKGDVADITLSHIYLHEVGGLVAGEENSGRMVMIPNSVLFEQNIINYTSYDEYVLDQVVASITYESNLDKAMKIGQAAAQKHTASFKNKVKEKPHIRTYFQPSAIGVHICYFVPAHRVQEISSLITKEIFDEIKKTKDVEIAYPRTDVGFKGSLPK